MAGVDDGNGMLLAAGSPWGDPREGYLVRVSDAERADALANAERLIRESLSGNTRRAYESALRKLDARLAKPPETDGLLAQYVGWLEARGLSVSSAQLAVAASTFRQRMYGRTPVAGLAVSKAISGFARSAGDRGRGQAPALTRDGFERIVRAAAQRRRVGAGLETSEKWQVRRAEDVVLAGMLFHFGMRRSEVAAACWRDVSEARFLDGVLVQVRRSKTNPDGSRKDIRLMKGAAAQALRDFRGLREENGAFGWRKSILGGMTAGTVARRFQRVARLAGLKGMRSHSGRVGLASELTAMGASLPEVMRDGNWKSAGMVAHYASAVGAERGGIAKYF